MADVRLHWGHRVFDPSGQPVQLPRKAVERLRRLGLLEKNRTLGGLQISSRIHILLTPEYDAITVELRSMLGTDLRGPKWLVCECKSCRRQKSANREDMLEKLLDFQVDMTMQRQQSAEN